MTCKKQKKSLRINYIKTKAFGGGSSNPQAFVNMIGFLSTRGDSADCVVEFFMKHLGSTGSLARTHLQIFVESFDRHIRVFIYRDIHSKQAVNLRITKGLLKESCIYHATIVITGMAMMTVQINICLIISVLW